MRNKGSATEFLFLSMNLDSRFKIVKRQLVENVGLIHKSK